MGRFDILDSGVPYSMDKTKNYVKHKDTTIAEISDLSNLVATEVGFIGHKANIHKMVIIQVLLILLIPL